MGERALRPNSSIADWDNCGNSAEKREYVPAGCLFHQHKSSNKHAKNGQKFDNSVNIDPLSNEEAQQEITADRVVQKAHAVNKGVGVEVKENKSNDRRNGPPNHRAVDRD